MILQFIHSDRMVVGYIVSSINANHRHKNHWFISTLLRYKNSDIIKQLANPVKEIIVVITVHVFKVSLSFMPR